MAFNRWKRTSFPRPCGRITCSVCGLKQAQGAAKALWLANPSHAVSFTQVGSDWRTLGKLVRTAFSYIRESIPTLMWAYSAEVNPSQTVPHTHGYFYRTEGTSTLSELRTIVRDAARRAHLGSRTDVQALDDESRVRYLGYPMKSLADPDLRGEFLLLNGTHLIHTCHHFWRDGRTGEPLGTRRRAIARANHVIYNEMKNRGVLV